MSFLSISGLSKRHGSVLALDGIDLELEEGARLAVLGPSGSGKSTLLRLIAGFDGPDTGMVALDGVVLTGARPEVPAHRRNVGFVTQDGAIFPYLSVAENVGFGLVGPPAGARRQAIDELLRLVDLDPAIGRRMPDTLSGGQQQRVAVARALARRPKLMLLDEAFSALDTALREATRAAVGRLLADACITTILVTHDHQEALSFADHVAVLREGRLLQVGPPQEIYLKPRDRFVAESIGSAIVLQAVIAGGQAQCWLGTLDVDPDARDGPAEILVRPEQIVARAAASGSARTGIPGRVTRAEFQGATTAIDIEPLSFGGSVAQDRAITLKVPSKTVKQMTSDVDLFVIGRVHVMMR